MQMVTALFFVTALGFGLATIWQMMSGHFDQILDALALRTPETTPSQPAPSAHIIAFPRAVTVRVPDRLAA